LYGLMAMPSQVYVNAMRCHGEIAGGGGRSAHCFALRWKQVDGLRRRVSWLAGDCRLGMSSTLAIRTGMRAWVELSACPSSSRGLDACGQSPTLQSASDGQEPSWASREMMYRDRASVI
jgi:hypothetical protein